MRPRRRRQEKRARTKGRTIAPARPKTRRQTTPLSETGSARHADHKNGHETARGRTGSEKFGKMRSPCCVVRRPRFWVRLSRMRFLASGGPFLGRTRPLAALIDHQPPRKFPGLEPRPRVQPGWPGPAKSHFWRKPEFSSDHSGIAPGGLPNARGMRGSSPHAPRSSPRGVLTVQFAGLNFTHFPHGLSFLLDCEWYEVQQKHKQRKQATHPHSRTKITWPFRLHPQSMTNTVIEDDAPRRRSSFTLSHHVLQQHTSWQRMYAFQAKVPTPSKRNYYMAPRDGMIAIQELALMPFKSTDICCGLGPNVCGLRAFKS